MRCSERRRRGSKNWRMGKGGGEEIYAVTEEVGTAREPPLTSCLKQLNSV